MGNLHARAGLASWVTALYSPASKRDDADGDKERVRAALARMADARKDARKENARKEDARKENARKEDARKVDILQQRGYGEKDASAIVAMDRVSKMQKTT